MALVSQLGPMKKKRGLDSRCRSVRSGSSPGIDLIDEDDSWLVVDGVRK